METREQLLETQLEQVRNDFFHQRDRADALDKEIAELRQIIQDLQTDLEAYRIALRDRKK